MWGIRIMHEASRDFGKDRPQSSYFVTLTLEEAKLRELEADDPSRPRNSLWKRDVQLFMKRLRHFVGPDVKSFGSGEYGDRYLRPHYHICLMHLELPELVPWKKTGSDSVLYRSPLMEKVWPYGFAHIGSLTQRSAEYTARYAVKKVSAALAPERYRRADPETGAVWQVQPEFGLMSKGLGADWLEDFAGDCASGFVILGNGAKAPVPRYYRDRLSDAVQLKLSMAGKSMARRRAADNTDRRLLVKHELRELKAARLIRELEAEL